MDGAVKHTPGPWVAEFSEFDDVLHITSRNRIDEDRVEIASVSVGYADAFETEQQANARLIAAAPDLLDALKAILRHGEMANIDKGGPYWGSGKKPPSMDAWAFPRHMMTEIEAAIAIAEGRP